MPIPEDDDYLCSSDLIQIVRDLMAKGWTAFQIRKKLKDKFPAVNTWVIRKIMKKAIKLILSEMGDISPKSYRADIIDSINVNLRYAQPKIACNLLGLKIKILALMGEVEAETLEERATLIREFLINAKLNTNGTTFQKNKDEIDNPKPESEQVDQEQEAQAESIDNDDDEITPDEEAQIKDAITQANKEKIERAKALKEKIKAEEKHIS